MSLKKSTIAIYKQIIDHFEYEIASGRLDLGERIKSIRELAVMFKVNPNTVQKALNELERDGLLITDRTNGKFVTEDMDIVNTLRHTLAKGIVDEFVENCRSLGISYEESIGVLEKNWRIENE